MDRMKGKTALVTGASAGIGYATVETLAKHGINVIGCAERNIESLEILKQGLPKGSGSVFSVKCDLAKEEYIDQLFKMIEENYKHVDILMNNAGRFDIADLTTGDTKLWRAMLDVRSYACSYITSAPVQVVRQHNIVYVLFRSHMSETMSVLNSYRILEAQDVTNAIAYVVTAPGHVCVKELIIVPTEQNWLIFEHIKNLLFYKDYLPVTSQ